MTDKLLYKQLSRHQERKAELKAKAAAEKASGKTRSGHDRYPVMSKAEQTRRLHELKAEFLTSKHLDRFSKKLFDIAMDDDHQGQMVAMKMVAERILPVISFSGESNKSSAVQINISGLQIESVEAKEVEQPPVSIQ
jgi:hypothetical protein